MQTSILVQSFGTVGFIVDIMSNFLQILEMRPEKDRITRINAYYIYNASEPRRHRYYLSMENSKVPCCPLTSVYYTVDRF